MKKILSVIMLTIATTGLSNAQVQRFEGLEKSGNNLTRLPSGWAILETGGANADGKYYARKGNVLRNDTYSFGEEDQDDRALGSLVGPNMHNSKIGAKFINDTDEVIRELLVSYVGEQWRTGGSGVAEKLRFAYSTNAESLDSGNWTDVPSLDFSSINTGTTPSSYIGNAARNRRELIHKIIGLNIGIGESFWIRWENTGLSNTSNVGEGHADALAVDDFSITPNPSTTPVSLVSFSHQKKGNAVQFSWETLSEHDNDYFELLRSSDGLNFSRIAKISGSGNSESKVSYRYTDYNPLGGVSYYRLKQVDYNGNSELYPVVWVSFEGALSLGIYVSGDRVNFGIYSPGELLSTLHVADMNSRDIFKGDFLLTSGNNDVKLDVPVSGVYMAVLRQGTSVIKKKFVINW